MAVFTWMISLIMGFWSRYFDNRWCVQTWIQFLVWSNIYLWIWTVESAEIFDCLSTSAFEIYTMTVGCQQQRNWIVLYNVVKSWTRNLLIRKVLTIRLATNFFCNKRLFITKCNNILVLREDSSCFSSCWNTKFLTPVLLNTCKTKTSKKCTIKGVGGGKSSLWVR